MEAFEPKPWEETDIDIRITHCGVCSTDIHTMRSELGPTTYPIVVGHEVIGVAVRVGSQANTNIQVGDRVGVGPQVDACLCRKPPAVTQDFSGCDVCSAGQENWCRHASTAYNGVFHSTGARGARTMGGYANYQRCPAHFVFRVPDSMRSEHAAPLMCAGATVYGALLGCKGKKNAGAPRRRPDGYLRGLRVGILGIGGLGHVGIQFARAMGADYVAGISRRADKRGDALALGASEYIATDEDPDWAITHANQLDVIISTVSLSVDLTHYLQLLRRGGRFVMLGMPGDGGVAGFDVTTVVLKQIEITGSLISSPEETRDMLQFAAYHGINPMVDVVDMADANQAVQKAEAGEARYRYVLYNGSGNLRGKL